MVEGGHVANTANETLLAAGVAALSILTLILARTRPARFAAWAIPLLLAMDLMFASRGVITSSRRQDLEIQTDLVPYLQELPGLKRFAVGFGVFPAGTLPQLGMEELWGYDALHPERPSEFFRRTGDCGAWLGKLEYACALNYLVYPEGATAGTPDEERYELLTTLDGVEVLHSPNAFPRAILVGEVKVMPDKEKLFEELCDPAFDPRTTALTELPPPGPLPDTPDGSPGEATIIQHSYNHATVALEATRECVLVLADTYYPGWRASIDGESAKIFPVNYTFRGVIVPSGNHTVHFEYKPASFRIGVTISIICLLLGMVTAIAVLIRLRSIKPLE
jgi:hypothetical protein